MSTLSSPYPLRIGQSELIDYLDRSIASGEVCLCHAPTGVGKTLAALLAALPNIPEEGKVLYAVNRKNQIPIILKELKRINQANGTDYKATAFASKADLCRDGKIRKLSYRELIEACEVRRSGGSCPYYNALFETKGEDIGFPVRRNARRRSEVAQELERRVLDEMPPPHKLETIAREVEAELGGDPVCIYELLKMAAVNSQVLIGTFWYYFHPIVAQSHLQSLSVDRKNCILICDEAHNLPRFCRDALSNTLSSLRLNYARRELRRYSSEIGERGMSVEGLDDFLGTFSQIYANFTFTTEGKHLPRGLVKVFLRGREVASFDGPVGSLEAAGGIVLESKLREGQPPRSHLSTVASFVRQFLLCDDRSFERFAVLAHNPEGKPVRRLEIRCLDPAPLSSGVLDPESSHGARASVLMSGTLVPGDYFKDILGISFASHREFPNVFPEKNRILFLDDSVSLAWRSRSDQMYARISERMLAIRHHTPGGCMFFFPSYEVMEKVKKVYPEDDVLLERRAATKRDEVEAALKASKSVLAVMGASLSEGLDLPGLIKATAVFGLPLERISDMMRLGMSYYEGKFLGRGRDYFYYLPAVTKIVQSIGRAHRTSTDKAALYVFDRRFCRSYLSSSPSWWSEEGIRVRNLDELVEATEAFWAQDVGSC